MPNPSNTTSTATRTVRAGIATDTSHGAVVPPLHLSTNFSFAGFDKKRKYDYTRSGNPTRDQLGDALAGLEEGVGSVITSSGMSAVALALQLVPAGGKVSSTVTDTYTQNPGSLVVNKTIAGAGAA